ncbi:indole-3-glycerol phosphate synthase TrpC [Rummeliibacillus sp. TYF005]|uniref:indole-3-glycerol phosphate synthase TrpC n=1 Tax=Rummeliibacillus sp. TYF005 TaxID=2058214 RepID=UPI000F53DD68|nr:indole-3-glycerol phosphate synthase TrpC [Rummeliibacillus sp. TYF005]RPJ96359.1 indole-3-glycerol phosphate synthase TrpC [Rummeliibacillus sp. TYF005]
MTTILDKIIAEKRNEVLRLKKESTQLSFEVSKKPSLFEKLKNAKNLQIISEIKRSSPSKGVINSTVNPVHQALDYEKAGAACISVLTDQPFFNGSFNDLKNVTQIVKIPVLCKDFIIDEVQIDFAKAHGASVILLIVAALSKEDLSKLYHYATDQGLEVLVEVHDEEELKVALEIDAKLIGINNRNLKTFEVDLKHTERVAKLFPFHEDRVLISESGIKDSTDAKFVAEIGASAVLVGETLMRSGDIETTLHSLQVPKRSVRI